MNCEHKNKRRVYTHGRKSKPMLICKDCGQILKRYELKKENERRTKKNNRFKKRT